MKKINLLGVILIASLTASWAQSDSLAFYPVQKYKLWKLVRAWQALPVCDSTVTAQAEALKASDSLVASLERRVTLKDSLLNTSQEEARLKATLLYIEVDKHKQLAKTAKKQAFKISIVAVVEAIIILLLI
ncbi:MAG: hypothetical protein WAZ98_03830 [Cyclobacteriaceae bacterium]